jgi:5-methylthioadenosine/S-adenosylhomocysteine deaminase
MRFENELNDNKCRGVKALNTTRRLPMNVLKTALISLVVLSALKSIAAPIYLEGYEPDARQPEKRLRKIYLLLNEGKIVEKSLKAFTPPEGSEVYNESRVGKLLLSPGFIDLHGHLKYHGLPIWEEAKGQFRNRFEWRALSSYKKAVSEIMSNPLFGSSTDLNSPLCKTIQYAEMKALIGGTTSIQGIGADSGCSKGILARNVEIESDYEEQSDVRVSTDLITPSISKLFHEMVFPKMIETGKNFDDSYSLLTTEEKAGMAESSQKRFLDLRASYLNYLDQLVQTKQIRAFIVHLSEGRSKDEYNKIEYKLSEKLGFAKEGLVIIHGAGLDANDMKHAADRKMSLVWSPYSNLLLYKETTDVDAALKAGLNITLGSDWSPTGSKNLLDEVKIAKQYLVSQKNTSINDRMLFDMMTINPAKALKLENKVGRLEKNYLADIVAIRLKSTQKNYYTQVIESDSSDIQIVFVGGKSVVNQAQYLHPSDKSERFLNAESHLANESQNRVCSGFINHVFTNMDQSISEITNTLKTVLPQMDDYLSCRDQIYQAKKIKFFSTEINEPLQTKLDSHQAEYEKLTQQLEILTQNQTKAQ